MSHDRDEDALFPNFLLKSSFGGDWEGHALPESLKKNAEKKRIRIPTLKMLPYCKTWGTCEFSGVYIYYIKYYYKLDIYIYTYYCTYNIEYNILSHFIYI